MDTNIIITVIFVLAIIVAFLIYQRVKVRLKGPLGTEFTADTSNPPGVKVKNAKSHEGGIRAEDNTGRGADAEDLEARNNIHVSSAPRRKGPDPKA